MDDIIARFLSREDQPSEDDIIGAIDKKYRTIHWDVLYLKRNKKGAKQIQLILGIGEASYNRAIIKLKKGKI